MTKEWENYERIKKSNLPLFCSILIICFTFLVIPLGEARSINIFSRENCWYVMDEYPAICNEIEAKFEANGRITGKEMDACPCKDEAGTPLNMISGGKFFEGGKKYVGEGCIYHKECKKFGYEVGFDKQDIKNINIDTGSPSINRVGNETLIIVRIINMNYNRDLIIKNIKFLDLDHKIVREYKIEQDIKAAGWAMVGIDDIISQTEGNPILLAPKWLKFMVLFLRMTQGQFKSEGYILDITDFNNTLEVGKATDIIIETEFGYGSESFTIETNHTILNAPPLPSPPHD
ncbi:MAG: hypothetical protein PHE43_02495 [Candidatus Nanoarchaeia archaeon]|nr:hypothetical protein [Candidatus Nanoarchaeia archaeon]